MTSPEAAAPPAKYGVQLDPGEKVDMPWQHGDPFDPESILPSTPAERAGLKPTFSGLDTPDKILAVVSKLPRMPHEPDTALQPPRPEAILEAELRRDHLLMLQGWFKTENIERALADIERAIEDYRAKKRPVPRELERRRDTEVAHLATCHERDEIARGRPEGCWCCGAGGRELVAIVPVIDGKIGLPKLDDTEHPPMRFGFYCTCPEAEAARVTARAQHDNLQARFLAQRNDRLKNAARIPPKYETLSLETFPDRKLARQAEGWYRRNVQRLADRAAGRERDPALDRTLWPGWLIWGDNRTGKTGLAIGCVKLALQQHQSTIFRTVPDLLNELRSTYEPDNPLCHADLMAILKNVPLLVLDDLGSQRMTGSDWVPETMLSLLDYRMNEQLMTIFTTNLSPDALLKHLGERIFWRVREPAHLTHMTELMGEAKRIAASLDPFAE